MSENVAGHHVPGGTSRAGQAGHVSIDMSRCPASVPAPGSEAFRAATATRWRREEAARLAIMGQHAGTAEGVRLLIQHDPGHKHATSILEAVTR
jgi:hypothetical protein